MRRRDPLVQDMTPLVDVVFLLLIFFLVTTVFKKEELALHLNLPAASEAQKVVKKREVTLELSADKIAYNGETIDFTELDRRLSAIGNKEKPIIVRIDESVEYRRIVKLFDMLQKYGLNNLQLVQKPKPKE